MSVHRFYSDYCHHPSITQSFTPRLILI